MELPPNQFGAIDEGATRALGTYTRRSTLTDSDNAKAQRVMSEAQTSAGPHAWEVLRQWTSVYSMERFRPPPVTMRKADDTYISGVGGVNYNGSHNIWRLFPGDMGVTEPKELPGPYYYLRGSSKPNVWYRKE